MKLLLAFFVILSVGAQEASFTTPDPLGWKVPMPIPQAPADGELLVEKVMPVEGRYVKGYLINPLDSNVYSRMYNGAPYELARDFTHGTPTNYDYLPNPTYQVKLADDGGFNYLAIRGGFRGTMATRTSEQSLESWQPTQPEGLNDWDWHQMLSLTGYGRWQYEQPLTGDALTFTWKAGDAGSLADISLYRLGEAARPETYTGSTAFHPGRPIETPSELEPYLVLDKRLPRFGKSPTAFAELTTEAGKPITLNPGQFQQLVTPLIPPSTTIGAVRLDLDLQGVPAGNKLLVIVQDPLNRRQELMRLDVQQVTPGRVRLLLDIPDQLMPTDSRIVYRIGNQADGPGPTLVPAGANDRFRELMADMRRAKDDLDAARAKAADQAARQEAWELYKMELDATQAQMRQLVADQQGAMNGGPGRRLWLSIVSEHGGTIAADSTIELLEVAPDQAATEWLTWRLALLKGQFGMYSESRPWRRIWFANSFEEFVNTERGEKYGDMVLEITETLYELYARFPDNPELAQYYGWIHSNWQPELAADAIPELTPVPGVPRWAQLLDRERSVYRQIVRWWLDNRLASDGEFGGSVNDDTCLVPWWTGLALIDSEIAPEIRAAHRGVMHNALTQTLDRGLNSSTTDYGHGYEYGINQTAYMPVLFYGDPAAVEQAMQAAWAMEQATFLTPEGKRIFKPHDPRKEFGARLIDQPLPDDPDWWKTAPTASPSGVNLHPMLILAWYNHHPRAMEILSQFENFGGGYDSGPQFKYGMYWLTDDSNWIPESILDDKNHLRVNLLDGGADVMRHGCYFDTPAWNKLAKQQHALKNDPYRGWVVTGKFSFLEAALERELWGERPKSGMGGMERYLHMYTTAEQHTDRLFLPIEAMSDAYLGGFMVRNKFWPAFAVSWEGFSSGFAAAVEVQSKTHLKVTAVNLKETPVSGAFRVWQLDHGRYALSIDGQPAGERELVRMDAIPVTLPPRQAVTYTLSQVEALEPLYERADLAIGEVQATASGYTATIHSLGARAVADIEIALVDASGKILASTNLASLEAPLDFLPRRAQVTLPAKLGAAAIIIDPEGKLLEITTLNNRAPLP